MYSMYRSYFPAFTTLIGAIICGIAILLSHFYPKNSTFLWFTFMGSVITAIGAFWSGHRGILSSRENKIRDEKIIALQGQMIDQLTGGKSFCYAYPIFNLDKHSAFVWGFFHMGDFPISKVSVRICNVSREFGDMDLLGQSFKLGTIFPGRMMTSTLTVLTKRPSYAYNLFFLAKNGSWTQEIRWIHLKNGLAVASRVVRDGDKIDQPIYFEISKNYPEKLAEDQPWNH